MSRVPGESYFRHHVLFHIHIAKSAGTSILDGLTDILGSGSVLDRNRAIDPDSSVSSLSWSDKRSLKLLSGHFWFGTQERYFERRPVYLAAVRDPIERFVSLFGYVLANETHPLYREFDTRGPDGSARWFFMENPRLANEMANSFGVPQDVSPVEWIERRYAIVAPTARTDSLIAKLYEIFAPEIPPRSWRSNPALRPGFTIAAAVAAECRAAAATDVLMCRQVEDRYDEWLHSLRTRLDVGA